MLEISGNQFPVMDVSYRAARENAFDIYNSNNREFGDMQKIYCSWRLEGKLRSFACVTEGLVVPEVPKIIAQEWNMN